MVQAAIYIKKKLKEDLILEKAFEKCKVGNSYCDVYNIYPKCIHNCFIVW